MGRSLTLERETVRLEDPLELEESARSNLEHQLRQERGRADRPEEELREARRLRWRTMFGG